MTNSGVTTIQKGINIQPAENVSVK